ncbi:MAG: hypothetical protein ACKVZ6_04505 [Kineosporiaceae bacterium]
MSIKALVPSLLDLAPGVSLQDGAMADQSSDRDVLRALADEGNERAWERLADLADARGDLGELNELLDEGCMRAGVHLTRRAVTSGDLLGLQRIADAGYDAATGELNRLLARPTETHGH